MMLVLVGIFSIARPGIAALLVFSGLVLVYGVHKALEAAKNG